MAFKRPQETAYLVVERIDAGGHMSLYRKIGAGALGRKKNSLPGRTAD